MKLGIMQPYFLPSAAKENLPVATKVADSVICLPMYAEIKNRDVERILEIITKI